MSRHLLLFDIDGTLVRTAGAGRQALSQAFEELFGVAGGLEGVRLDGNTDPMIYEGLFRAHLCRSPTEEEEAQLRARYLEHLGPALELRRDGYQVMPGVRTVLAQARDAGMGLALCTGNIEPGARLKLGPGGIEPFFPVGGFGSDSGDRWRLVELGWRRAEAHFAQRFDRVTLFGDTERDVDAARRVGIEAVGVLAGASDGERLERARPDRLASALDDPQLLRWLDLG